MDVAAHAESWITPRRTRFLRSDRCSGGPSRGPRWWQMGGGGGPHFSHPISLSQHGSSRCRSGPPAVYANTRKLANVCEVTCLLGFGNIAWLCKCGIPSLCLWCDRNLRSEQQLSLSSRRNRIYWGKMLFFPPFSPSHLFPCQNPPIIQLLCNVCRHILFNLISDKAFRGCFTRRVTKLMGSWVFFFSYVVAPTREIQSQEDDGWFLMNVLHKCNTGGRKLTLHQILQLEIPV